MGEGKRESKKKGYRKGKDQEKVHSAGESRNRRFLGGQKEAIGVMFRKVEGKTIRRGKDTERNEGIEKTKPFIKEASSRASSPVHAEGEPWSQNRLRKRGGRCGDRDRGGK